MIILVFNKKKKKVGWSSLHEAISEDNYECASLLIENEADINCADIDLCTSLHLAARCGYVKCLKLLIEQGAHVNVSDESYWTPLHEAVTEGYVECVQILISSGADVNLQDIDGNTPLHKSIEGGNLELTTLLVENHASLIIKNENNLTPMYVDTNSLFFFYFQKTQKNFLKSELAIISESEECFSYLKTKEGAIQAEREKLALQQQELLLQEEEEEKKLQLEKKLLKKEKKHRKKTKGTTKKEKSHVVNENQQKKLPSKSSNNLSSNSTKSTSTISSIIYPPPPSTGKRKKKQDSQANHFTESQTSKPSPLQNQTPRTSFVDTFALEISDEEENELIRSTFDNIDHLKLEMLSTNETSGKEEEFSKVGLLNLQLEAAQHSIVTLEKELQMEKQKNSDLQNNLQSLHQEVAQIVSAFTEKVSSVKTKFEELETKFEQERLKNLCSICLENDRDVIFLPCTHFLLCSKCYQTSNSPNKCSHCDLFISGILQLKRK